MYHIMVKEYKIETQLSETETLHLQLFRKDDNDLDENSITRFTKASPYIKELATIADSSKNMFNLLNVLNEFGIYMTYQIYVHKSL